MYTFKTNLVNSNKHHIKCPYSMTVEYITVHDTGNSAPAENEIAYMIRNTNEVSFHLAVDEDFCIQGLPFNCNSWSCGDGAGGTGNRKSISVEICRPLNDNRALYDQAEENAVYVVARLLYQFNLSVDKLRKHQDWSGKICPNVILSEGRWESFKSRVKTVLDNIKKGNVDASLSSGTTNTDATNYPQTDELPFIVVITCDELNIRNEPNFNSKINGVVTKGEAFTIVELKNGLGRLKSGAGWISMNEKYVRRK